MSLNPNPRLSLKPLPLSLAAAALLLCCGAAVPAFAQTKTPGEAAHAAKTDAPDDPAFQIFKGVRIGMAAEEARKKLGSPTDKGDAQDFYHVSDAESVQVMYDAARKVSALALIYVDAGAKAPTAKTVMGDDVEARPDGSVYKMVRYPKAGYWVSYSRTAGDAPVVSVTMQKMN